MDCAFVYLNPEGEKSMRTQFFSTIAVAVLFSAPILADEPIELSAQQMDQITAGVGSGAFPGHGSAGWFGGPTGDHGLNSTGHFPAPPGPTTNAAGVWVPPTPGNPG